VSQQNPVIQAPGLRLKLGGRLGAIDPSAIAKAEAALKSLSGNFAQWLSDEITKLDAARGRVREEGVNAETMEGLYLRVHEFPLITTISASLCRLIDDKDKRLSIDMAVVDAHIEAIKTAVREDIKTEDQPQGRQMLDELERKVAGA
jgi:hypothetical protein